MRDHSCHTVRSIINAFEKSVNFYFKLDLMDKKDSLLSCQPRVTVTSCFVYNDKYNFNLYTPRAKANQ